MLNEPLKKTFLEISLCSVFILYNKHKKSHRPRLNWKCNVILCMHSNFCVAFFSFVFFLFCSLKVELTTNPIPFSLLLFDADFSFVFIFSIFSLYTSNNVTTKTKMNLCIERKVVSSTNYSIRRYVNIMVLKKKIQHSPLLFFTPTTTTNCEKLLYRATLSLQRAPKAYGIQFSADFQRSIFEITPHLCRAFQLFLFLFQIFNSECCMLWMQQHHSHFERNEHWKKNV